MLRLPKHPTLGIQKMVSALKTPPAHSHRRVASHDSDHSMRKLFKHPTRKVDFVDRLLVRQYEKTQLGGGTRPTPPNHTPP